MKKFKLTPKILNKIIAEEKAKLQKLEMIENNSESIVENNLKAIEQLSIKENELAKKLKLIREAKRKIKKLIVNKSRK
jgi:hypothetical protein